MRTVALDNDVEFRLSKGTLIELALFTVENRDNLVVSCSISHVYVTLEVSHEKTVLLFERILSHDQMLIIRVYQTGRKPHKLLRSIPAIDFPSIRVYGYNFLYQFLSGNAHQRAEDQVTDASTHYVQLQPD